MCFFTWCSAFFLSCSFPCSLVPSCVPLHDMCTCSFTPSFTSSRAPSRVCTIDRSRAQWGRTAKNTDVSTGPLARRFTHSLAPLTHPLAPDCWLRSRTLLRSLVRSFTHLAHSLARGRMNYWCLKMTWFCPIVPRSATGNREPNQAGD